MLPNETEFKQSGNLTGEDVKMTFDENSLDFLAEVLINLYSDKELAVIREYSTNARDSHIAAGQTRPIEISTPTYLSYNFKVKDYGVGLSKDDIYQIYSKYGASTKRATNEQVGMLGLGCKSALTYSDRFSIISTKDGKKIMVDVSRSESGGGQMSVISERDTDEPNGVEIIVPVNRNNDFKNKAQNFFKFWDKDEVLIDGKPPMDLNLVKVTDKIFLKEDPAYYDKSYLVMGGVPYEIDPDQITLPKGFVAFADIGSISFTPSREHLHYTHKTKATLDALKEEYKVNIMVSVQNDIDAAPSKIEAIEVYYKWYRTLRNQNITISASEFKYKNKALQTTFKFDGVYQHGTSFSHISTDKYNCENIELSNVVKGTVIYGFDKEKLTSYQKSKLRIWAEDNNKQVRFFFCKKIPGDGWLDDVTKAPWSAILDIKIPRSPAGVTKAEPSYEIWCNGKYSSSSNLDIKKPIWYSTKSEFKECVYLEASYANKWFEGVQFVFVGKNRLKKFHAKYPGAVKLNDGLHSYIDTYVNSITDQEKALIESDSYERQKFAQLDAGRVLDPDLSDLIESSGRSEEIAELQVKWEDMVRISRKVNYNLDGKLRRRVTTPWIYARYPLFNKLVSSYMGSTNKEYWDHLYLYLNSAYHTYKVLKDKE